MSNQINRGILRATIITGSARIITILGSILKIKVVAIHAGTQGVGLIGVLTSTLSLINAAFSFGLDTTGSREIAAAKNLEEVSTTVSTLKKICLMVGLAGGVCCFLFADLLSSMLFKTTQNTIYFKYLSITILFTQLSLGYTTVLRGLAKVKDLAVQAITVSALSILGAFFIMKLWPGNEGVVFLITYSCAVTTLVSWWFSRKTSVPHKRLDFSQTFRAGSPLLQSGLIYMVSNGVSSGGTFMVAVMIQDNFGLHGNGLYQAAWTVSISLTGLMLAGMGQDFYPKLTKIIAEGNSPEPLVKQQTEIGLLMSLPALLLLSVFADSIIPTLYTNDFKDSATIVPFLVIGCFGRVLSWPLAYLLMSKGMPKTFLITELLTVILHLLMVFYISPIWGLQGIAISFAALYFIYGIGMSFLIEKMGYCAPIRTLYPIFLIGYTFLFLAATLPVEFSLPVLIIGSMFAFYNLEKTTLIFKKSLMRLLCLIQK